MKILGIMRYAALLLFLTSSLCAAAIPIQIGKNGPIIYIPVGSEPTVFPPGQGYFTQLRGVVESTSGNTIVVRTTNGTDEVVYLTNLTHVNGSLQTGSTVHISGRNYNGALYAETINVVNAYGFNHVTGTVTSVSGNTVVVQTPNGYDKTVYLTDQTAVNGSLNVGSRVNVSGYYDNGAFFATTINFIGSSRNKGHHMNHQNNGKHKGWEKNGKHKGHGENNQGEND